MADYELIDISIKLGSQWISEGLAIGFDKHSTFIWIFPVSNRAWSLVRKTCSHKAFDSLVSRLMETTEKLWLFCSFSFLTPGPFITLWVYLHYDYSDKALVHLKIWGRVIELVIFSFKIDLNQKEDWKHLIQKVEIRMLRTGIYFSKIFTNPLHDASSRIFTKRKEK